MTSSARERTRPPRIIHLLGGKPAAGSGTELVGAEGRQLAALTDRLAAAGHEVVVAGSPETNQWFGFSAGTGVRFVPLDVPDIEELVPAPGRLAVAVRDAKALIAGAALVHAHGQVAGLVAATAAARQQPFVVTWQRPVVNEGARGAIWVAVQRVVARRASVILASSPYLVDEARRLGARDARLAQPAGPSGRVARGDDTAALRAEIGLPPGTGAPLLVTVGQLVPDRRYDVLLEAVGILARRDPPPRLVMVGAGPERENLQERIDEERLPVTLLGSGVDEAGVDEVARVRLADLVAAADVAVLSGGWEGRALLAYEALAAGVPLVGAAEAGLRDLVGSAALLLDPPVESRSDTKGTRGEGAAGPAAHELAAGIARVLDEPVLAKRLVAAGRTQAASLPDEDEMAAQVLAVYAELLEG